MCRCLLRSVATAILISSSVVAFAQTQQQLEILDQANPWYPDRDFPALRTPAWVGEKDVEAVVVLAIDDMREPAKYEAYLRPILNRLKQIDGRAPVSMMTCRVDPTDPQLQSWLNEGLSIEVHTVDHPCPILNGGDLAKARSTYERCVDLMSQIPGNQPVAFRTPCCDSLNTVSPRFYSEIFAQTTEQGRSLQIDSSVFNFFTAADPEIPRELILDAAGHERFQKYRPRNLRRGDTVHDNFVNFIENYPYPYVIDGTCWQFPCVAPSDWSAQHLHGVNNPVTVDDWKAALDITVVKQGVFNLVFHPHGWMSAEQIVELIDHAVEKHGRKVQFLTFREAADRLNRALTDGVPLRDAPADVRVRVSHQQLRRERIAATDLRALTAGQLRQLNTMDGRKTPPLIREDGTHSGAFLHDGFLCWQTEDTAELPDLIRRVAISDLEQQEAHQQRLRELPPVMIGAASVDVTPTTPVRLTGYGNRASESEGVAAQIHARALVIGGPAALAKSESRTGITDVPLTVLITVDNCGVPQDVVDQVCTALAESHQLSRERITISSTHTHSGPWLRGFAPNIFASIPDEHAEHLQMYEQQLIGQLIDVVEQAVARRRAGRLSVGSGQAGFAINRRSLRDGQWVGFGEVPDGPADHQLPILAAHDSAGKLIAVLAGYACHATTETGTFNQISGDWPGFAADLLEQQLAEHGHEQAVALIAIGCGADANPTPRGTHEQAQQHGQTVATEVLRLLQSPASVSPPAAGAAMVNSGGQPMRLIDPRVMCRMTRIDLPHGPLPSQEEWEHRASQDGVTGAHARYFLNLLKDGQTVPAVVPDYPVQTWCFGDDLAMVFLGGEVVVDYAIRLGDMFDANRLWVNAYSNDVPCYIASRRILREGGYEVDSSMLYYRRPTRLAPEAEDLICDAVQKLLPHSFYSPELQADFPGPRSPEESLAALHVASGLR
ncbi:MAG: neutral/alkaline non-lysosomal ceramidase N-terminal domain-containing protein, partial [Planctomycetaceae bacterium]|nr:neutral/alkaline non-lysosomal ceramidase N-terminal domain-containing protein [Planctomycetaceae bacterium]